MARPTGGTSPYIHHSAGRLRQPAALRSASVASETSVAVSAAQGIRLSHAEPLLRIAALRLRQPAMFGGETPLYYIKTACGRPQAAVLGPSPSAAPANDRVRSGAGLPLSLTCARWLR